LGLGGTSTTIQSKLFVAMELSSNKSFKEPKYKPLQNEIALVTEREAEAKKKCKLIYKIRKI
jgi:hypothetical protein